MVDWPAKQTRQNKANFQAWPFVRNKANFGAMAGPKGQWYKQSQLAGCAKRTQFPADGRPGTMGGMSTKDNDFERGRSTMRKGCNGRLTCRLMLVLAVLIDLAAIGAGAQTPGPQPRRFLAPSVEEVLTLWREPPQVCSQAPFWFWNGPLDPETMRRQIRMMADKGVHAALPHPRFGMDRRFYLEEPFWRAMDATMDEAQKTGSSIWLYDEYNWPSGGAGGRVTDGHPEFYPRGLDYTFVNCEGPRDFTISRPAASEPVMERFEKIVAAFIAPDGNAIPREPWGQIDPSGQSVAGPVPSGPRRVLVFFQCLGHNPSPLDDGSNSMIDYLRPEPTRRFLELTHEAYAQRYGGLFGKQIPTIFYDEPSTMAPAPFPWTFGFDQVLRERRGLDLLAKLPALLDDTYPDAGSIRAAYWQTVSERFNECFFDQIEQWCRRHGLALTGHCYEENIASYTNSPQLMEQLRRVDWPGYDALGTRARPAATKIPISVAHLENREEIICEALGLAGGWNCTLDMLRGGYNQIACLGATTFIPHAFFQTVENPRVECPPSFFHQNPYWKYYGRLSGLTDRLSLFNRIGRHVAPALVYYPIESLWMDSTGGKGQKSFPWQHTTVGNKGAQATINGFGDLVDGLFNNLWDLDIADGKALEKAKIVRAEAGARIAIGPESYRVLVFPPVRAIAPSALRVAAEFTKAGGTVIWTGRKPETCWPAVTGEPQRTFEQTTMTFLAQPREVIKSLAETAGREIAIESGEAKGLRIQHRRTPAADLYLCFNDSDRALDCRLILPHTQTPSGEWLRLETETGEVESVSGTQASVPLILTAHASAVLLCTSRVERDLPHQQGSDEASFTPYEGPWTIQVVGNALDEVWSTTPGDTVVELPGFRHRGREFQPVSGWERRDYDDSNWEKVYAVRDGALFVHASPALLRGVLPPGAKAIETPLPVTGEYVLYVNGVELDKHLGPPVQPGRIDLSKVATGRGDIVAIETTSHSGPAGLQSPLRVVCGPAPVERLEPWSKWNLPWYCGRVLYRTEIQVPDFRPAQRWLLDLGEVQHYAEVWLNGKLVGTLLWPPYRIELTGHVKKDKNELVLVVSNSLANRFAWDVWGTRGKGKPEPSGLLGPVKLLTAEGTK
jgi:hypothetical protein